MKYLLILLSTVTFAQKGINVEYESYINRTTTVSKEKEIYVLSNNNVQSLYKPKIPNNTKKYINAINIEKKWNNKKQKITSYKIAESTTVYSTDKIVFKDLEKNLLLTNRILITTRVITDESDIEFEWDIVNTKKPVNILGYDCQKAFTKFRGRTYAAYFTTQLPFLDGPYKFKGLPGLILKVESVDGYYTVVANKINLDQNYSKIENPFSEEKKISLERYKEVYRKTLIKRFKASKSIVNDDESGPITITFDDKLEDIGMGIITIE